MIVLTGSKEGEALERLLRFEVKFVVPPLPPSPSRPFIRSPIVIGGRAVVVVSV
jgi:hypothetical protein